MALLLFTFLIGSVSSVSSSKGIFLTASDTVGKLYKLVNLSICQDHQFVRSSHSHTQIEFWAGHLENVDFSGTCFIVKFFHFMLI